MDGTLFLQGLLIGLSVAVPIGPMGLLCISRTLCHGVGAGLATGAGASTVQGLYCAVLLAGLQGIRSWLDGHGWALSLAGAALMPWFAWRLLRSPPGQAVGEAVGSLLGAYASAVALNAVNPVLAALLLAAVTSLFGMDAPDWDEATPLLAGLLTGSAAWWVVLCTLVSRMRRHLAGPVVRCVNHAIAAALVLFGVLALTRLLK